MREALAALPPGLDPLAVAERLRARLGGALARRAAELFELRARAERRFEPGWLDYPTRKGLEQASAQAVAHERARRVAAEAPGAVVWDATTGLGSDAIALGRASLEVVASDLDPEILLRAAAHLGRHGLGARVVRADVAAPPARADVVLIDPDRRATGRRSHDPRDWSPTLEVALSVARRFAGGSIRLTPLLDPAELPARAAQPAFLQWVSLRGELSELNLWLGALAEGRDAPREAVVLDGRGSRHVLAGAPGPVPALGCEPPAPGAWLAEPDPAVIRARLLSTLARSLGLAALAPRSAYLVGPERPRSPFLRSWRVLGTAPLDRRRVRELLGRHDVGPLVVKKRGHPDPAEVLARRLAGPGTRLGLLAVARLERGHLALLLDPGSGAVGDEGFEPPTSSL